MVLKAGMAQPLQKHAMFQRWLWFLGFSSVLHAKRWIKTIKHHNAPQRIPHQRYSGKVIRD